MLKKNNISKNKNNQFQKIRNGQNGERKSSPASGLGVNRKGFIETDGIVEDKHPSTTFKVILDNGHEILAHLSGKMRVHRIKILPGDKVKVEISPYDLSKGRITYRY